MLKLIRRPCVSSRKLLYPAGFIAMQLITLAAYASKLPASSAANSASASKVSDVVGVQSGPYVAAHAGISIAAKKASIPYENRLPSGPTSKGLRTAPLGSISSGYVFNNKLRADVAFTYRGNYVYKPLGWDSSTAVKYRQNVKNASLMLNGYLSLIGLFNKRLSSFDPYLMAGAGWSANMAGDILGSNGSNQRGRVRQNFAWQVGAGTAYRVSQRFYLDLNYKYAMLGQVRSSNLLNEGRMLSDSRAWQGKLNVHDVSFGVIYKF